MIDKRLTPIILSFLFFQISCKKENELDIFYNSIEKNLGSDQIKQFKSTKFDSTGTIINIMFEEMTTEYSLMSKESSLKNLLNESFKDDSTKITFLILGFHDYCNGLDFNYRFIEERMSMIEFYNFELDFVEYQKYLNRIAEINNLNLSIGDTISVCLPIRKYDNAYENYYFIQTPLNFDCETYKTVNIEGVILNKRDGFYLNVVDTMDLIFDIKIISSSNSQVRIDGEMKCIGDTFNLYVTSYGKIISSPLSPVGAPDTARLNRVSAHSTQFRNKTTPQLFLSVPPAPTRNNN